MVGSSLTDEEKRTANTRLKIGFVLLVAGSMVLMSLRADLTVVERGGIFLVGIGVGTVLLWYVLRNLTAYRETMR